jgi:hypothetical protein
LENRRHKCGEFLGKEKSLHTGVFILTPFIKPPSLFPRDSEKYLKKKNSLFSARSGKFWDFFGKFTSKNQAKMLLKLTTGSKTQVKIPIFCAILKPLQPFF